jgi:colicin import membrane protein
MSVAGAHEARHEQWLAVLLSVLLHGAVVALLGWGWWQFHSVRPAPRQLAIEATVVVEKPATVTPAPAAAPAASLTPPPAAPAPELAARHEREQARQEQAEQERESQRRAEEQARREREQQHEQAQAQAKLRSQEAAARKAEAAAHAAAQDKARREAELRAQLAAEERVNAARGSAEEAAWLALIRDRVTRAWIRPPSARAGVNCEVHVTQVPGGVVTGVQIGSCNGDSAVRESIEAAVYRASPLPMPSNPDLFDRNLKFNFHPDE